MARKKTLANARRGRPRLTDKRLNQVANVLHDGPCQQLTGALYLLQAALLLVDREPSTVKESLRAAETHVWQSLQEIRAILVHLRAPTDDDSKVVVLTLEELTKQSQLSHGIIIDHSGDREVTVKSSVANALIRTTRELLNNALMHAKANRVTVKLVQSGEQVVLCVEDNGIGFDVKAVEQISRGFGLVSIKAIAEQLGGRVTIHSEIGRGTCVIVELPRYGRL